MGKTWGGAGVYRINHPPILLDLCEFAKAGSQQAKDFLLALYQMKVYDQEELDTINALVNLGLPLDEALRRVNDYIGGVEGTN